MPNRMALVRGVLLATLGVLTVGIGVYFLVFRPVMLPEDLRFTGVRPEHLPPGVVMWLSIVFRTWGGFMAGLGLVLLGVAGHLIAPQRAFLAVGTALGICLAFGRFLLSNITIQSDHLTFIAVLFGLAMLITIGFLLPGRQPDTKHAPRNTI